MPATADTDRTVRSTWSLDDGRAMARALVLAETGRATVRPNPAVGCVIVSDGRVVGEGAHRRAGGPHAEVLAVAAAGDVARGATVFVTLEPCAHVGRTGPCTQVLRRAGVARVVYALADPTGAGGGGKVLAEAGIRIESGLLAAWARVQNRPFLHAGRTARPYVTLKLAQTIDGELVTAGRWITAAPARAAVHRYRALSDAVLVGSGTVLHDDPRLDVRDSPAPAGQPRAVVLDGRGRTPPTARVVRPGTIVVTTAGTEGGWRDALRRAEVDVVEVAAAPHGGVVIDAALSALAVRGVQTLLVEGGAEVARAFVTAGRADRLVLHVGAAVDERRGFRRMTPAADPPAGAGWWWRTESRGLIGPDLEIVAVPTGGTPLADPGKDG